MKITDFSKQYPGYLVHMRDFSSNKRILVLKGENGSGKSTVLKAISRLISYSGKIDCKGTISFMNESIKFPKDLTVMEVLNAFNHIDRRSVSCLADLIDHFEINDKINENILSLSKGMIMKLQLICTFLADRDIYLLDEPFSGLDDDSIIKLVNYIDTSDKKFIIASHIDVSFQKDCDVILV